MGAATPVPRPVPSAHSLGMAAKMQSGVSRRHYLQHSVLAAGPDWTKLATCLRRTQEAGMTSVVTERQAAPPLANSIGEGATALMYACQQSREQEARCIIDKKPDAARERDRTLKTALHYCAETPELGCAELLVAVSSELIDSRDEDGYTPLHLAVIAGNRALIRFLLARGADVNALDNEGHSVVHWATVCGEVEALELVLDAGAAASTPDIHGGYPVHYAAQMCGPNSEMGNDARFGLLVLRKLLAHGVDVNVRDRDGRQPILWAASAGSADAILALVNAGASVEADDKDGLTALHCAASRGHTDCIETLVSLCGAETDVIDSNGCTALFYAVTLGHADSTQLLLAYGAEPNRQDRKGRTPAHCGAAKGQLETLRILGAHGANLWVRNARGDYPLHEAVSSGRKELVRWLLAQRPDAVNAPNNDGRCPLHIAAVNNNVEMCKIILDGQALLNPVMRTSKGHLMTPLDAALYRGNRGCAKYLQLHGGVPANKLTDKTASIRGGTHRDRVMVSETHSEQFTTPECMSTLPVPGGRTSMASSPLVDRRLLEESLSDRAHSLQVRLNEDVAIRHVERLDGPIVYHHYCGGDSSEEGHHRWRRRRRRRRRRGDVVEREVVRRRRRDDASDDASEGGYDDGHVRRGRRRRRRKSGSSSSDRRDRSKVDDTEYSSDEEEEEEDGAADSESVFTDERKKKRKNRRKSNQDDSAAEEQGSDVEYVTVKKTTVKTKKTTTKSKTDEEEVKEAHEEDDGARSGVDAKKTGLEVDDSTVERSESREREVVKKTVTSSMVREKKQKAKPKENTSKGRTKHDMAVRGEQKGSVRGMKDSAPASSTGKKDKDDRSSKKVSREDPVKERSKESFVPKSEEAVAKELAAHVQSSPDEVAKHSNANTPSLNEQESDHITHTVVTAIVHQQDVVEEEEAQDKRESTQSSGEKENTSDDALETAASVHDKGLEMGQVNSPLNSASDGEEGPAKKIETEISQQHREPIKVGAEDHTTTEVREPVVIPAEGVIEAGKPFGDEVSEEKLEPKEESEENHEERTGVVGANGEIKVTPEKEVDVKERDEAEIAEESEEVRDHVIGPPVECESEEALAENRSVEEDIKVQEEDKEQSSVKADDRPVVGEDGPSEGADVRTDDEAQELEKDDEDEEEDEDEEGAAVSLGDRDKAASVDTTTRTTITSSPTSRGEDSSMMMDSGFEPSPRRDKAKKNARVQRLCRTDKDEERPSITAVSVTRAVQNSMRKYHLERQIFQELLELKRLQIRAGRANEQVLVKRLADEYSKAGMDFGPQQYEGPYNFRTFEKYLYDQLRLLQTTDRRLIPRLRSSDDMEKLSSVLRKARFTNRLREEIPDNPVLCTHGTHRCHHAAHAYTGVPCAAYITKLNHHHVPKGPAVTSSHGGFLPRIDPGLPRGLRYVDPSRPVTLELSHGADKQVISLPTERLDRNKRYYVTFTIKGSGKEEAPPLGVDKEVPHSVEANRHQHAKSL